MQGRLKDRLERDDPVLGLTTRDAWRRALSSVEPFQRLAFRLAGREETGLGQVLEKRGLPLFEAVATPARAARRSKASEAPDFGSRPSLKIREPALTMPIGTSSLLSSMTAQPSEFVRDRLQASNAWFPP